MTGSEKQIEWAEKIISTKKSRLQTEIDFNIMGRLESGTGDFRKYIPEIEKAIAVLDGLGDKFTAGEIINLDKSGRLNMDNIISKIYKLQI